MVKKATMVKKAAAAAAAASAAAKTPAALDVLGQTPTLSFAAMRTMLEIGAVPAWMWREPKFVSCALTQLARATEGGFKVKYPHVRLTPLIRDQIAALYALRRLRNARQPPDPVPTLKEELRQLRMARAAREAHQKAEAALIRLGFLAGVDLPYRLEAEASIFDVQAEVIRRPDGRIGTSLVVKMPYEGIVSTCDGYTVLGWRRYLRDHEVWRVDENCCLVFWRARAKYDVAQEVYVRTGPWVVTDMLEGT